MNDYVNEAGGGGGSVPQIPAMQTAAADQLSAEFRELTEKLIQLHREALVTTLPDGQGRDGPEAASIRGRIIMLMATHFVEDPDATKIFNYILYLIDTISGMTRIQLNLGTSLNKLSESVNDMADLLGMEPVYQPQVVEEFDESVNTFTTGTYQ